MAGDFVVGPEHFPPDLPLLGEGELSVAVGPASLRLRGLSKPLEMELRSRYQPFIVEGVTRHDVILHDGNPSYLAPAADGFLRLVENSHDDGKVLISDNFASFRSRAGGSGHLRLGNSGDIESACRAVENYLRWAVADLALDAGGFIFHAAGLVKGGEAFVFFGHSGAGKSTISAMSPEADLLSDDMLLILCDQGDPKVSTTLFRGSLPQGKKCKGAYPLRCAFRIRQSTEVRAVPLPAVFATSAVLSCCPFVSDPVKRAGLLIPLVEAFCASVPVMELHFRKEPSFWGVVEDAGRRHERKNTL